MISLRCREWDQDEFYWKTKEFLAWLYNNAPNRDEVVVNDRWAKGMPGNDGDYYSSEYRDTDAVGESHPWEESRGMGPFLRIQPRREHPSLPDIRRSWSTS